MIPLSRKGQVTIQLNWIFVMIAGGVILLFFASLIRSQIKTSEDRLTVQTISDIDKLLTATFIATESYQLTPLPDVSLELGCREYVINEAQHSLGNRIVFGPSLIQGDDLFSWSKDVSYPFRVTNFLYITSPEILYLFVYPDNDIGINNSYINLQLQLRDRIATNIFSAAGERERQGFNYQFVRSSELAGVVIRNNYHVRTIYLGVDPVLSTPLARLPDEAVSGLQVQIEGGGSLEKGRVTYLQKQDYLFTPVMNGTFDYLTFEFLLGAIFSETTEQFRCNLDKFVTVFLRINEVYTERAELLEETYRDRLSFCEPFYIGPAIRMNNMTNRLSDGYNQSLFTLLPAYKNALERDNTELLTGSCETIY